MPAFHLGPVDMLRAYAQEIEQIYNSIKETHFFSQLFTAQVWNFHCATFIQNTSKI